MAPRAKMTGRPHQKTSQDKRCAAASSAPSVCHPHFRRGESEAPVSTGADDVAAVKQLPRDPRVVSLRLSRAQ